MSRFVLLWVLLLLLTATGAKGLGYEPAPEPQLLVSRAIVLDGDTIPYIELKPVVIFSPRFFSSRAEENRHRRLVHNVRRVYPFARLAGQKFAYYTQVLDTLPNEAARRRLMRQVERDLRSEFEDDLVRLTTAQGAILIRLIDRETQHSSFEVVREFRGAVSAVFWQSLGRIFGYNLRVRYDPNGQDRQIEEIVLLIEAGLL